MTILIEQLPDSAVAHQGPLEYVELTWDQRCKPHSRLTTSKGTEIALSLPRGFRLTDGLAVYNSCERTIVIKSKPESVVLIKYIDIAQACRVAHQLGNWHRSLQVLGDAVITLADAPLTDWLRKQDIAFDQVQLPFEPNLRSHSH